MIKCAADISQAYDDGGFHLQPFYKVWPSTYSTANGWWDATMAGNFPRASYYNGDDLVFTPYPEGNHLSFFHGGNVAPKQKILRTINIHGSSANLTPSRYILCDYLGFYGGISWETDAVQEMTNTVTLPRYTNGQGVRAFVVQLFGNNANAVYTVNYRNAAGVDTNSPVQKGNTLGTGGLQHGQLASTYNPFIDLCQGCTGIQRINSVTVSSLGAGIAVLVLVKPIAEIIFRDSTLFAPVEVDYLTNKTELPIIYDGAKLNFLFTSVASPAALLTRGYMEFIWI
jgi:hypothetical protein